MATKTITIKVNATDDGSLKKVVSQLKAAGIEVDKVATAHKRAGAAADDHFHRQAKGVSGVANGTKSFSKMASSINGDNNSLVGAYAALAANIFAVTAAFNALKNAAEVDQVIRGLEASGTRVGLTYGLVTKRVQETADGMLSLQQSARSTAQVLAAGFNADQVVRITEAAKNASFALGRDMTESMDRLTRGVIKLEPELLDELGIMVRIDEASSTYARTLGKTASQLTAAEKRQGFFNATLAEAELKFGGIADAAGGASGFTKLAATFDNLINTIFNGLNKIASPIAALFSTSPTALLGGMLLFASSIKGQLMPGLVNASRELAKNAEASSQVALANIANISSSAKWSENLEDLAKNARAGTLTLDDLNKKQEELENQRGQILDTRPYMGADGKPDPATQGDLKKNAGELALVGKMQGQLNKANAATTLSNSVLLASNGNLLTSFKTLGLSIKQYSVGVNLASTSTGLFSVVSRGASIAGYAFSASLKVVGVAMLQILPWLGVITIALGLLWAGWKKLEEVFVGKEVLAARKELKEVMGSLVDKEKEYLRIRESTASAASKNLATNILVSNSINEQAAAIEKLMKAEKERELLKANPEAKKQEIQKNEIMFKVKSASSSQTETAVKTALVEAYFSSIDETSAATKRLVGTQKDLEAILLSKGPQQAAEAMKALTKDIGGLGEASKNVSEELKGLNIAVTDFITSATPSTPYDKMVKSLTTSVVALSEANVAFSTTKDGAEKFAASISEIGDSSLALLDSEAIGYVKTIQTLSGLTRELTEQEKNSLAIATKKAPLIAYQLAAQQEIFSKAQNAAIVDASRLQLASAYASKLATAAATTAEDTGRRIDAENAVLGMQAKQLLAQAASLKAMNTIIERRIEEAKLIVNSNKALQDRSSIMQKLIADQAVILVQEELSRAKADKKTSKETIQNIEDRLASRKKEAESAAQLVKDEAAAAQNRAGQLALQNQAQAILSGTISVAVKEATEEVTRAQTALNTASETLKLAEESSSILKTELSIRKALGENINVELESALNYYYTTLPLKKAELKAAHDLTIANLALKKAKQLDVGNISSAKETDKEIARANELYANSTDLLDSTSKLQTIQQLGLKTLEEMRQAQIDIVNSQVENLSLQQSINSANSEILEIKKKTELLKQGRNTITPEEELANAKKLADEKINALQLEYDIKSTLIKMEYALLDAKQNVAREEAFKQLSAITKIEGPNSPTAQAYIQYISALNKSMGYTDERLSKAVNDNAAEYIKANPASPISAETATQVAELPVVAGKKEERTSSNVGAANALLQIEAMNVAIKKAKAEREALNYVTIKSVSPLKEMDDAVKNLAAAFKAVDENTDANNIERLALKFQAARVPIELMINALKELGPEGTLVAAISEGMLNISSSMLEVAVASQKAKDAALALAAAQASGDAAKIAAADNDLQAASMGKLSAQFGAAASVVGQLSSILKAGSDAKIANIDREIAAEQQRDGKSEASVARIKAMESKKEAIAKKSFEIQKKLQIASAVISTAAAVTGILAQSALYGAFAIPLAIAIGAMGAAQVALIAGTSYQSAASSTSVASPSAVSVGSRGNSVDLARNNTNVGGELGYLQGNQGTGTGSGNFRNRAYGGYGHAGMIVGEKGPELFVPSTPGNVVANDNANVPAPINANINIHAIDAEGVEKVLTDQKGHIIGMLREAANSNGQNFLESVNTAKYRRGGRRL